MEYSVNISWYFSMAIPIIPLKKLHCKESVVRWGLLDRQLHLHLSQVPEAYKLVR
jgi:hypothetical protein